ncbi:recombinase family protein [Peribacillus frigoritolerans]|uniref:recombinase family protein n=1 Tax=Peribacillus frigoritolerans TaxID=450367 RepID=UPI003D2C6C5D
MSFLHKYIYNVNGIYLVTEEERPELEIVELPWHMYKDPVKLATGYIRWSDEKQTKGFSLSIQEREITIKAKSLGFSVVVIFVEAATSAFHNNANKREKMNEMKEFILGNPNANTVIFYDESRVTRLIADFYLDFILPIRQKKPELKLFSTKMEVEWDENNPLVQMRLSLDYDESQKKSYTAAKYHVNVINKPVNGKPNRPKTRVPYGYSKSGIDGEDELIPNEAASIVQFIFYLYSFGYSERKIAKLLESSNVPSPSGYSHWNDSTIRYLLNNLWYKGDLVWFARTSYSDSKKKPLEEASLFSDHHQALIGPALWKITQNFRNSKNKDRMDSPFILRNIIFCSDCGEELNTKNQTSAKSKKDGSIYFCTNCKCKIQKDVLHQKIINDFTLRWSRELKANKTMFKEISATWKKLCNKEVQSLKNDIENLRYKMQLLNPVMEYYEEFLQAFKLQLKLKEENKLLYNKVLIQIDCLLEDQMTLELIDRYTLNVQQYSNEEKRSIILLAIKKIVCDFKRDHCAIEYRLSPYIDIESIMDSIKERKTS